MIAIFPEVASASFAKQYDKLGILVRQYFGGELQASPQISMVQVIESCGLSLARGVLRKSGAGAILARDKAGRVDVSVILPGASLPIEEERFLLAHLLGHWFVHIQPSIARGEWQTSGYNEDSLPSTYFEGRLFSEVCESKALVLESEANLFAISLLLPKSMIVRAFEKLGSIERIARFFQTPVQAVEVRLQQLGVIWPVTPDFVTAERRLTHQPPAANPTLEGRELINALADKMPADRSRSPVPRSFAASSYGTMQKQTDAGLSPKTEQKPAPHMVVPASKAAKEQTQTASSDKPGAGLSRIRELARKMDPSV
jgi:Zn-dependent peptidase ImmA (M78 family)